MPVCTQVMATQTPAFRLCRGPACAAACCTGVRNLSRLSDGALLRRPLKRTAAAVGLGLSPLERSRHCSKTRRQLVCTCSLTVQAAASSSTTWIFSFSTVYCLGCFLLMLLAPSRRLTQRVTRSEWLFVPLALAYTVLLVRSWEPDTLALMMPGSLSEGLSGGFKPQFFPSVEGITQLFSRVTTAASLWVHLLAINLFAARTAFLEGRQVGFPCRHSVFLCMFFGPVGLLCHFVTRAISKLQTPS